MAGQLSFFSASAGLPDVDDLAGVLCGPGQAVRREDAGARISVVLADDWRVAALTTELALRDLAAEVVAADDADGWAGPDARSVRTPFTPSLDPLAQRWAGAGAGKRVPSRLTLDGPTVRLWYVVAGRPWEAGFALGVGEHDAGTWPPLGALLAAAGLPATFVGPRGDGPAYRMTGRRRLTRLAELVGDPPPDCPPGAWPDLT